MNDEELKNLWHDQPLPGPRAARDELISAMQRQTRQLRLVLSARDLREIVANIFVALLFGIFYFTVYRTPVSRLGTLIVIGGTVFSCFKLVYSRWRTPPAPSGASLVESLRAELNLVLDQSRLLNSVLWWYLLPGFVGVTVATWGLPIDPFTKSFCTIFFIAVDVWIYRLNRRAVSTQLLPLETELKAMLRAAETGEPLDEKEFKHSLAVTWSISSGTKANPAEFRVRFWQIALFAEIGFVGMWLASMLGLSAAGQMGRSAEQARAATVQTMRVDEINRYRAAAKKVIDLLNAGDFDGLHKLYNPAMSRAFPLKKSSTFYSRLMARHGQIEKLEGPAPNRDPSWIDFRLRCEQSGVTMSLALDSNNQIAGIRFRPAFLAGFDIGFLVHSLFSWLHLVWLVPFVIAGLLFAKLLQKATDRAVGISALGIHLLRGHILFPWEDIQEVRPFRFLHIRSLRLISRSGQKMIMPWTSLERHSELKSAVEASSPVDHPIRKYLSLLNRS